MRWAARPPPSPSRSAVAAMDRVRPYLPKQARTITLILGAGLAIWAWVSWSALTPHNFRRPPPHIDHRPYPPPPPPPPAVVTHSPQRPHTVWDTRAEEVRAAFLHAYRGYQKHAAPHDELLPVSDDYVNNFNGWGVQLYDALDTMWIMGLREEFHKAMPIVANTTFALEKDKYAPFFETVIRYLGGLLSAYALSGEPILLARADDLGKMLLPVFNTTSGLPKFAVNTVTGETRDGWATGTVLWAEAMSCQMEYKYLAHLTGRREYFESVEHIMDIMHTAKVRDGLFPTRWSIHNGKPSNDHFSVGAFADSAHEYLLKQWLLSSKSETKAKDLYLRVVKSILEHLLYLTPNRQLLYVTDAASEQHTPSRVFEHLSCFLPGLLALGAHTLPEDVLPVEERELHMWAARGLASTCWVTYADHPTGLGPDEMVMEAWKDDKHGGKWLKHVEDWKANGRQMGVPPGVRDAPLKGPDERDYTAFKKGYFLRPEAVESFYLLWRTTGDPVWRERGWAVFQAIEKETKTSSGYASLISVEDSPAPKKDEMPSFFMAETLKYLFLLFTEEELVPLDRWVFNTEAHPLPVFEWSDWERQKYNIW